MIRDIPAKLTYHVLSEHEWPRLRSARLTALRQDPDSFLASYETEEGYDETRWRSEFKRGTWVVIYDEHDHVSALVGIVKSNDIPPSGRYIEYLWVAPSQRRCGIASLLLKAIRENLKALGITSIWLWVLNGNEAARSLYESNGFASTKKCQPLRDRPGRYEERFKANVDD